MCTKILKQAVLIKNSAMTPIFPFFSSRAQSELGSQPEGREPHVWAFECGC